MRSMASKKILIYVSLIVFILIGIWVFFDSEGSKKVLDYMPFFSADPSDFEPVPIESISSTGVGEKLVSMLSMAKSLHYSVNAYLQVVDQHGQSVSNARVKIVVAGSGLLAPGTGDGFYHSDTNGLIKIEGKGRSIDIQSVTHPEISEYKAFVRGEYIESLFLSSSGQHAQGKWTDHAHVDNPFKIHVWRTQSYDDVESRYFRVKVPVNDGFYYVSPTRKTRWLATRETDTNSILGF